MRRSRHSWIIAVAATAIVGPIILYRTGSIVGITAAVGSTAVALIVLAHFGVLAAMGAAFGVVIVLVGRLWRLSPGWLGRPQAPSADQLYTLLSVREMVGEFFYSGVTLMVFLGVTCLFLLLLLHIIFRRKEWLASGVAWLLLTLCFVVVGRVLLISLIFGGIFAALLIGVANRFGLLAVTTTLFMVFFFGTSPMTTDFSAWYAPSTIFALAVTLALVVYAFYITIAGQKVFKGKLLLE